MVRLNANSSRDEKIHHLHQLALKASRRLVRNREAANDLAGDVMLNLIANFEYIRFNEIENLEKWMFATIVATKRRLDLSSVKEVSITPYHINNLIDDSMAVGDVDVCSLAKQILHEAPEDDMPFLEGIMNGIPLRETCDSLGIGIKRGEMHVARALRHIRRTYASC